LWKHSKLRKEHPELPQSMDDLTLADAESIDPIRLDRMKAAARQLATSRRVIDDTYGTVQGNPWYGIAHGRIEPLLANDIVRRMNDLATAAEKLAEIADQIAAETTYKAASIEGLASIAKMPPLEPPPANASQSVMTACINPENQSLLNSFRSQL